MSLINNLNYVTNNFSKALDYLKRFPDKDLVIVKDGKWFSVVSRAYAKQNNLEVLDV